MRWVVCIGIGLAIGALLALVPAMAAISTSNNGEFVDTATGAYTAGLYLLYGLWLGVFAIPAILAVSFIGFLLRRVD